MKILYLDIETAPHLVMSWGLFNQNIGINQIKEPGYTLCFAAKMVDQKTGKTLSNTFHAIWDHPSHDSFEMVSEAWNLLNEADAVVTYNGNKFDIPTLNREFVMHAFQPPSPYYSIDLYRTVRSKFRFASNKLDFVCQSLGIGAKVKHVGMDLWIGCMNDDKKCQRQMMRYNKQDVKLLPLLYEIVQPYIPQHPTLMGKEIGGHVCPTCGSSDIRLEGKAHTAAGIYQRYSCNNCGKWSRGSKNLMDIEQRAALLRNCQ